MASAMDEKETPIGLYKVNYEFNGLDFFADLLLPFGRKRKRNIKKIIEVIKNIDAKLIKKVKLRFLEKEFRDLRAELKEPKHTISLSNFKKKRRNKQRRLNGNTILMSEKILSNQIQKLLNGVDKCIRK
jgi:hypothetical protein